MLGIAGPLHKTHTNKQPHRNLPDALKHTHKHTNTHTILSMIQKIVPYKQLNTDNTYQENVKRSKYGSD
jgi:hypothetical protein